MKITTLKDLKDFLGTLTDDQLKQRASIAVDDTYYYINDADFNDEERVWNDDMDEGNIPTSEYDPEQFNDQPLDHPDNIIFPIGSIVILSGD